MTDALLEWISFRQTGRMTDLPVERRGIISSNLSALGHIEVVGGSAWRIAPPTLASIPGDASIGFSAVLCGARTVGVVNKLHAACQNNGATFQNTAQDESPSRVLVSAPSIGALAEIAARAGTLFQLNAGYTLLACLPSLGAWPRRPCEMPGGKVGTVKRFSGSEARWIPSTLENAQSSAKGFYRVQRDWDWVSVLKSGVTDCAYIDDRAGRLLAAAKRRHASWTAESRKLDLPAPLFPPAYIARALVLCSGLLPDFDRGTTRISFSNVTPEMLRLALAITGLRLA
jgi:hypothetical protein